MEEQKLTGLARLNEVAITLRGEDLGYLVRVAEGLARPRPGIVPLESGRECRLSLGEYGETDYLDVIVRADGKGLTLRTGEGAPMVIPQAGNQAIICRTLFTGGHVYLPRKSR